MTLQKKGCFWRLGTKPIGCLSKLVIKSSKAQRLLLLVNNKSHNLWDQKKLEARVGIEFTRTLIF